MPAAKAGCCIARPPSSAVRISAISVVRRADRRCADRNRRSRSARPRRDGDGQHARAAATITLMAPASVRRRRCDPGRRAGRTASLAAFPLGADQKSDAKRCREVQEQEGRSGMFFLFADTSWQARQAAAAAGSSDVDHDRQSSDIDLDHCRMLDALGSCSLLPKRRPARQEDRCNEPPPPRESPC